MKASYNLINEVRRAAEVRGVKGLKQTRYAPRLQELSDKHLVLLWEAISKGASKRSMAQVIKRQWKQLQDVPDKRLEILIGRFQAQMEQTSNQENAIVLAGQVAELKHEVKELTTTKKTIEQQIVDKFNPLYELAELSATQKERIARFTQIEAEDEKPSKQLDEMIDKQRLLIAEFVKAARDLRIFQPTEEPKKVANPAEQHLHQVHVHLQSVITSPKDMTSAINQFDRELDELVIVQPSTELINTFQKESERNDTEHNETGTDRQSDLET